MQNKITFMNMDFKSLAMQSRNKIKEHLDCWIAAMAWLDGAFEEAKKTLAENSQFLLPKTPGKKLRKGRAKRVSTHTSSRLSTKRSVSRNSTTVNSSYGTQRRSKRTAAKAALGKIMSQMSTKRCLHATSPENSFIEAAKDANSNCVANDSAVASEDSTREQERTNAAKGREEMNLRSKRSAESRHADKDANQELPVSIKTSHNKDHLLKIPAANAESAVTDTSHVIQEQSTNVANLRGLKWASAKRDSLHLTRQVFSPYQKGGIKQKIKAFETHMAKTSPIVEHFEETNNIMVPQCTFTLQAHLTSQPVEPGRSNCLPPQQNSKVESSSNTCTSEQILQTDVILPTASTRMLCSSNQLPSRVSLTQRRSSYMRFRQRVTAVTPGPRRASVQQNRAVSSSTSPQNSHNHHSAKNDTSVLGACTDSDNEEGVFIPEAHSTLVQRVSKCTREATKDSPHRPEATANSQASDEISPVQAPLLTSDDGVCSTGNRKELAGADEVAETPSPMSSCKKANSKLLPCTSTISRSSQSHTVKTLTASSQLTWSRFSNKSTRNRPPSCMRSNDPGNKGASKLTPLRSATPQNPRFNLNSSTHGNLRTTPKTLSAMKGEQALLDEIKKKMQREQELMRKREERLRLKVEEQKRKREARMQKAMQLRKELEDEKSRKIMLLQQRSEKLVRNEKQQEEERQKMVHKKMMLRKNREKKIEMRRKVEEETRLAKLREQEDLERQRALEMEKYLQECEKVKASINKHNSILQQRAVVNSMLAKAECEKSASFTEKSRVNTVVAEKPVPTGTSQQPCSSNLNSTYVKEANSDLSGNSPTRLTENYWDIRNLKSDDSTDDESSPRHTIPSWAQGMSLKNALINQYYSGIEPDALFGNCFSTLDLTEMFATKHKRLLKRTSSFIWTSPIHSSVALLRT